MVGLARSERTHAEKWYAFRHLVVTGHAVSRAQAATETQDVVVFPEGLCQRAFMTFVDGGGFSNTRLVMRFIDGAPLSDVVVALKVDPEVALERIGRRDQKLSHRFGGRSRSEMLTTMRLGQRLLMDVASHVEATRPGVRVVRIRDGDI